MIFDGNKFLDLTAVMKVQDSMLIDSPNLLDGYEDPMELYQMECSRMELVELDDLNYSPVEEIPSIPDDPMDVEHVLAMYR